MRGYRVSLAGLGAAVLVGLAASRAGWLHFSRPTRLASGARPELNELVQALGAYRPLEARLTGGFAYGAIPASSATAREVGDLGPDIRIAIAKIEKRAATSNAESDWAALGTSYVMANDLEKGLQFLEAAVATPVPNPAWLSDLSAVYLSVARQRDRPELIPKALVAAEKARRLNGRMREAVFNKALALEAIHLTEQAEAAWKAYRELDRDSPWGQEAFAHLTRIEHERAAASTRWERVMHRLEVVPDGSYPDIGDVKSVRHLLRGWIETTLLPAWAERELSGDSKGAREQLRRARSAAALLLNAGGDQMPSDGIRAIDQATQGNDRRQTVLKLAKAHLAFQRIARLTDEGNFAGADGEFRLVAGPNFSAGRSPYQHWAQMYRAIANYGARRFSDARAGLETSRAADTTQYHYLTGRRKWMTGLILANEGHLLVSLDDYHDAYETLRAIGEADAEASVAALLAEVLARLGSPAEAWRHELTALEHVAQFGSRRTQLLLLGLGGVLCLNADQPEAALHFQNAVISASSSNHDEQPFALAEGYRRRAQIAQRLGDAVAAKEDLGRAKAQLPRIADLSIRHRAEAEFLVAEAFILSYTVPVSAIASATRAIEFFRDSGGEARTVELHLTRGRAHLAAEEPDLAEKDFTTAIQHFEEQRNGMSDRQYRASFFQDGWQVFAEMARVQVLWRKNAAAALDYAERGRARTLLEAAEGASSVQPLTVAEVQRRLPDRTAALFFMPLDDRLLIWTVRNRTVSLAERPIGAAALGAKIDRLRWQLRQSGSNAARLRSDLEGLFEELIEPVLSFLGQTDTIAVLPDGPLHSVPFAALKNPKSGRYLVQDFVLMTAPSLSTLVRTPHLKADRARPLRALVIGNPAHPRTSDEAWLPQLPFSQVESEAVAATYQNALLLTGEKATKRAVVDNMSRFDVVHYAGHAVVNEQIPGLSRLLMALDGGSNDDGVLFVRDLATVRLDDTMLVVLAACSTGSGRITNGEGIGSIARPFLEAGASTVVATLWDVQDQSAAALFQQFHQHVARGQSPAAALALVQRQLIEDPASISSAPSQWAWAVSIGALTRN